MKVLNIHTRIIDQPKAAVSRLLETLASEKDMVWPTEYWPAMRFLEGLKLHAKGGHGPIRYTVEDYNSGEVIQFQFTNPHGFHGYHKLEISELSDTQTQLKHTINMHAMGSGIWNWIFAIRHLHDALIEDAFDKVENHFSAEKKRSKWNLWVRILRSLLKAKG